MAHFFKKKIGHFGFGLGHFWTRQKYLYLQNGLPYSSDVKPALNKNQFDFIKHI